MKRILIIITDGDVLSRSSRHPYAFSWQMHRKVLEANLVILKSPTHFCCIKNRWVDPDETEKIPNFLLVDYLKKFEQYFTKEDLLECLL